MSQPQTIKLDGIEVSLFRGKDGKIVVDISSDSLNEPGPDMYDNGVPNIRIWINEQKIELNADGDLIEEAS